MAAHGGDVGGGGGVVALMRQGYLQIPPVTRVYLTACVMTTLAVHFEMVSPFQLYFNPPLVYRSGQIWRLVTTFLFFGSMGLNFLFNLFFTYRYFSMLETGSFRGRTADFVMMFLFGAVMMIVFGVFVDLLFLGQAFTIMFVYVWGRRNPQTRMSFIGIINFRAPYLPWVLLGFSILLGNSFIVDLLGIGVGHVYYFLEDVFPNQPHGKRLLVTPAVLKMIFDPVTEDPFYNPPPEDRPGGFNWGNGANVDDARPDYVPDQGNNGANNPNNDRPRE
ncbi:hypothetical protein TCAL_11600 [Tigriopus californicus]|uniref:Derlin n=1 Tax=Tigriopus californicus TaxID=6832 RepID=A0A553PLT2_TIGCA|nr:derlin-2-like [Tigriopus californicus]TRY78640.1 hypothetical protein TCAL_11600 [Tigriopus californicus]|eukprot:TCALIF_11600-PA protein Name:"Similar to DERL2 Derlin-2 (Pongo abelii)" AED:0.05 eAED:0.05 QI:293/1/1/1/1/1/2/111/275